jgi:DNA repair protein RecO (recombination protein O)
MDGASRAHRPGREGRAAAQSASRSVLVPFQPLVLDWFGRGELKTLKSAEPTAAALPLGGASLFCAFYLNELLLKLTHRDDPHERLFEAYDRRSRAFASFRAPAGMPWPSPGSPIAKSSASCGNSSFACCRRPATPSSSRARRARTRPSIPPAITGTWSSAARWPVEEGRDTPGNAIRLNGQTLVDLERGRLENPTTVAQSKPLMRLLINHLLNGQELATRTVLRELQSLSPDP